FVVLGFGIVSKTNALCTNHEGATGRVTRVTRAWRDDFLFRGNWIPQNHTVKVVSIGVPVRPGYTEYAITTPYHSCAVATAKGYERDM
ncbi:hypothetical protein LINPERPRIM_LOCUS36933, partial [Linum perenne]